MERSVITVDNLVKRYGDLLALAHFNLDIKEGEIFGLLGPNGSGTVSYTHLQLYRSTKSNNIYHSFQVNAF